MSQTKIGRPVSGSKPKKHITRTVHNNPSLISNSVSALFKYQAVPSIHSSPDIPMESYSSALPNSSKINNAEVVNLKYVDSLSKAEHDFVLRKEYTMGQKLRSQSQFDVHSNNMGLERRQSSFVEQYDYNYVNHQAIKNKQAHGYNIITCYPSGQ